MIEYIFEEQDNIILAVLKFPCPKIIDIICFEYQKVIYLSSE